MTQIFFCLILKNRHLNKTSKFFTMKLPKISNFILAFAFLLMASCAKEKTKINEKTTSAIIPAGQKYILDTQTSKIEWKGYKIFKSENTSHFGTVKFDSGELTVKTGQLQSGIFTVDMTTLTSEDLKDDAENLDKLNSHLKSEDFFNVEKFPTAVFEITKVSPAPADSDYNAVLDGNFTVKNVTKQITFKANVNVKDNKVTIATEPTDISRRDYGIIFQIPLANGLIKDEITLQILIHATQKS